MKRDSQKKALLEAIEIVGSQTLLANAINTSQQNVSNWLRSGSISPEFVIPIENATSGKVNRHRLNPVIYPIESKKKEAA